MQSRGTVTVAALSLAIALGLAACGDDDSDASSAGTDTEEPDSRTPNTSTATAGDPTTVSCTAGGGGTESIDIVNFTFDPSELTVGTGAGITFTNQDSADHAVWSAERIEGEPAFESVGSDLAFRLPEVLHEADASTCTFPEPGTYEYICGVHNSMTGTVTVE